MNSRPFSVPADDFPEPMLLVSPDGEVLAINRAGELVLINDEACRIFGLPAGEGYLRLALVPTLEECRRAAELLVGV